MKQELSKEYIKMAKKAYKDIVKDIESADIYDGRGTVDLYVCEDCGHRIYTTYLEKGVTPFSISCPHCEGHMIHEETYKGEGFPSDIPVRGWYRPSLEELLKCTPATIDHVLNGGLLLKVEE